MTRVTPLLHKGVPYLLLSIIRYQANWSEPKSYLANIFFNSPVHACVPIYVHFHLCVCVMSLSIIMCMSMSTSIYMSMSMSLSLSMSRFIAKSMSMAMSMFMSMPISMSLFRLNLFASRFAIFTLKRKWDDTLFLIVEGRASRRDYPPFVAGWKASRQELSSFWQDGKPHDKGYPSSIAGGKASPQELSSFEGGCKASWRQSPSSQ